MRELKAFPGVWPHDLRRTYATACAEAGIDPYTIKLLLNHAMDKTDVTSRYIKPSVGHVASAAQCVADFLDIKLGSGLVCATIPLTYLHSMAQDRSQYIVGCEAPPDLAPAEG